MLVKNEIRGLISSETCDRFVKAHKSIKMLYIDAKKLSRWAMSQPLPNGEIEMLGGHPVSYMDKLKGRLKTPDDSDRS